jgi:hypothetical protein
MTVAGIDACAGTGDDGANGIVLITGCAAATVATIECRGASSYTPGYPGSRHSQCIAIAVSTGSADDFGTGRVVFVLWCAYIATWSTVGTGTSTTRRKGPTHSYSFTIAVGAVRARNPGACGIPLVVGRAGVTSHANVTSRTIACAARHKVSGYRSGVAIAVEAIRTRNGRTCRIALVVHCAGIAIGSGVPCCTGTQAS